MLNRAASASLGYAHFYWVSRIGPMPYAVRCDAGRLTPERRQELAGMAADVGISASALARLAILRLLNSRDALVHLSPDNDNNHERAA
jgi:hypothetical protein